MSQPWASPGHLARCDKCDKEFEKLLCCGRCKNAFYCSRDCQNSAWKNHKNICRRPGSLDEEEEDKEPKPIEQKHAPPVKEHPAKEERPATSDEDDDEDPVQTVGQFRQELLRMTQVANAKMVQIMQESKGDPSKFLPQVLELKEEYHHRILDNLRTRNRALSAAAQRKAESGSVVASPEDEDQFLAAVNLGRDLMKEVIMAILLRGLSHSACVDQIDLANNHFNAGILWPRQPSDFALEDGDLDGFGPAATKLREKGFVCVDGLLDDEIATVIYDECKSKFWECRDAGAMRPSAGAAVDGFEHWIPYPPRKGTTSELEHALRVLFGLPNEIQQHGYPLKLKVPTTAHLGCFVPRNGREGLHLDNNSTASGGRELTFVLFCTPRWIVEDGGAFRGYMTADEGRPGPRPQSATPGAVCKESGAGADSQQDDSQSVADVTTQDSIADGEEIVAAGINTEADASANHFKDFEPEAGRCLIFRSRELWHEMLVANRLQFALTLFVQCAE